MSTLKDKLVNIKNRLSLFLSRLIKGTRTRWRSLTPGFRYAIVYFLCVICIASLVWWQFNPGSSLVFDPTPNSPPESQDTQDQDPSAPPEDKEEGQDENVFSPLRGDKLILPLQGEILAAMGEGPFTWLPGIPRGGIDGIHIDGTAGDAVCAAWQGIVERVIVPDTLDAGAVWIRHGEWTTVYINIEGIIVNEGQTVQTGEKIGELAAKLFGSYSGDYLEFQLWGPAQEVCDPRLHVSATH